MMVSLYLIIAFQIHRELNVVLTNESSKPVEFLPILIVNGTKS